MVYTMKILFVDRIYIQTCTGNENIILSIDYSPDPEYQSPKMSSN